MITKGIYNTLVTQLDKLARHNRQGSFRTKDRYYEAVKRFYAYLAAHYHLQKQDRTWTNSESGKLIGRAMAEEREDLMPLLGIGRNTAYELIRSGQIRSVRIGRQIRIPRDALLEFLRK